MQKQIVVGDNEVRGWEDLRCCGLITYKSISHTGKGSQQLALNYIDTNTHRQHRYLITLIL
jgi:hypothetical protein